MQMPISPSPNTINTQILSHYGWQQSIPNVRQRKAILLDNCFMTYINNNFKAIGSDILKQTEFLSYLETIFKNSDVFIDEIILEETYTNFLNAPQPLSIYHSLYSSLFTIIKSTASSVNYVTLPQIASLLSDYRYGNDVKSINSIVSSITKELYPEIIDKSDIGKTVELIYSKLITSSNKNIGDRSIQVIAHLLSLYGYKEVFIYSNDTDLHNTYSRAIHNTLILQQHGCSTKKLLEKINVVSYDVLLINYIRSTLTDFNDILVALNSCRSKAGKHIFYLTQSESSNIYTKNETMANEILASRILETNNRFIF